MFSVVLATVLTTASADPAWCHGCKGCHGCYGCHGCHGCYGCSCYGCSGCWSCYGCWGGGCWGCYGCSCSGCWGCYGYGCSGCYGCYGCYGGWGCYGCGGGVIVVGGAKTVAVEEAKPAKVVVSLPADAKLYVEGQLSKQTSASRTIVTPALEGGSEYTYTLKVELTRDGKTVTENKEVAFRAGSTVNVDFSQLGATATASR